MAQHWDKFQDFINSKLTGAPPEVHKILDKIALATGQPKPKVASIIAIVFIVLMVLSSIAQLLCNLIGVAIPFYYSMGAIETPGGEDDTMWLTYWCVYAVFSLFDFFADRVFRYFPFYWLGKCVFFIWCYYPTDGNNGSKKIHQRVLRPFFLARRQQISTVAKQVSKGAIEAAGSLNDGKSGLKINPSALGLD